ncbi:hypothetical protein NFI96_007152, partial [Prochilodus magdalenae]
SVGSLPGTGSIAQKVSFTVRPSGVCCMLCVSLLCVVVDIAIEGSDDSPTTMNRKDQAYYENNLPGTDDSMKIRTVYESVKATRQTDSGFSSVNSSIKQPDEVFQSVTPSSSTIQPDSLYCTVMTRVNHLYPDYQSLIPSTRQSNSDYQTLNPNATKSDSVYQSLTPHTKQVNSIYHTLNPINNQIQSTKTQPQISTN